MVQAVPIAIAGALTRKTYYFVPLALSDRRGSEATLDRPRLHARARRPGHLPPQRHPRRHRRRLHLHPPARRPLRPRLRVLHQRRPRLRRRHRRPRGLRPARLGPGPRRRPRRNQPGRLGEPQPRPRRRGRQDRRQTRDRREGPNSFLEAAFSDAVAIYQLSLAVDFDYSELREREYPLLAPQALADRLRLVARLFPPNPSYEFAIRYRRRA